MVEENVLHIKGQYKYFYYFLNERKKKELYIFLILVCINPIWTEQLNVKDSSLMVYAWVMMHLTWMIVCKNCNTHFFYSPLVESKPEICGF